MTEELQTTESVILNRTHPGVEREQAKRLHAEIYAPEIIENGVLTEEAWQAYLTETHEIIDIQRFGSTELAEAVV